MCAWAGWLGSRGKEEQKGRMRGKNRVSGSPAESVYEVGFWVGLCYREQMDLDRRPYGVWGCLDFRSGAC